MVIVVACMHKLLAIVYGVLKSRTPFDASRFAPLTA
ncbi:MAG: IS110 family transposase, partial [Hydrogenophaga sp.]|nr:IS110 family transposase [Hydrogenophaga sp.]MDO9604540.1 IS110 family transposase [Hydrogenophaga sp.]